MSRLQSFMPKTYTTKSQGYPWRTRRVCGSAALLEDIFRSCWIGRRFPICGMPLLCTISLPDTSGYLQQSCNKRPRDLSFRMSGAALTSQNWFYHRSEIKHFIRTETHMVCLGYTFLHHWHHGLVRVFCDETSHFSFKSVQPMHSHSHVLVVVEKRRSIGERSASTITKNVKVKWQPTLPYSKVRLHVLHTIMFSRIVFSGQ